MDKEKSELLSKYNSMNSELNSVKHEMQQLRKSHNDMEKEISESRRLLEERISEDIKQGKGIEMMKRQTATQLEALNAEREKFKGETSAKQSIIDRLQQEKEDLLKAARNLANNEEERNSLMRELEIEKAKGVEVKKLTMEISTLDNRLKKADKAKEEALASLGTVKDQLSESQKNVQRLEMNISSAKSNKESLSSEVSRLNNICKEYVNQKELWNIEKSRTAKEIDNLQREISSISLEKDKLQSELSHKTTQIEQLRRSITSEVESQVSKVVQERDRLAATERKVRNDFEDLCLKHATLQVHKEKMERDIEDLQHDVAREKKSVLSAERMRVSLQEQLAALKDKSETERRSRSEVEVLKRKLTISLDSMKRQLQERTDQLVTLQKVINPRLNRSGSISWEDASKDTPELIDLAKKLDESERARKKAEESKALLKAQLEDAKQRWTKTLDDRDSEYYATRRALLEDLASISTNPSSPPTPARGTSPTKAKRPLSSNLSSGNFQLPAFDLKSIDKENLNRPDESVVNIRDKSPSEVEGLLRNLQSSKNDLLGVYHETSKNLVKVKEQLADELENRAKLEREVQTLRGSGDGAAANNNTEEMQEIALRLDAEISRNQDLQESIHLYKNRSDEYYSKLETAETIVLKASRAEQFAKSQCKDAEESLAIAKRDNKQQESIIIDLQSKLHTLEGELEDKNIDLNHSKEIQQRLSKEIEDFNARWSSEMSVSHSSVEAMRKRYSEEIRSLSEELELQKQSQAELHSTRRHLERQIDELRNNDNWQMEKSALDSQISDLSKANEDATLAYQDSQKRIGSLLSQVRTLRSTMNDITADRDQLQKDKRNLENRLTEISQDFEDLASSNLGRGGTIRGGDMNSKDPESQIVDLRRSLKKQQDASAIVLERLRDSKAQLEEDKVAIERERRYNEELQKQIAISDKEKKQLHLQLLEMETNSLGVNSADESKFLRQKVNELETQLEDQARRYADDLRSSKSNDRSVRELYNQMNQKDKNLARLQEENTMNEEKIKKYKQSLEFLQGEETTHRLAAKRAEREARDAKENALRIEKELEEWKSRFESLTSNRLSKSEYGRFV